MVLDQPPTIWLPPKPAVVRPADPALLRAGYLPVDPDRRRDALRELVRTKRITPEQARDAFVFYAPPIFPKQSAGLAYLNHYEDTSGNSTTKTFSTVNIGTGPSFLVLVAGTASTSTARTINGITVAGSAATLLINSPSGDNPIGMFGIAVAAGGTATVVVTLSGTLPAMALDVWALTRLISTTPVTTQAQANNPSATITPVSGGVVVAAAITRASTSTSWSALGERSDRVVNSSFTFSVADAAFLSGAALIPQATFGSNATSRLLVAAFR